MVFVNFKVIKSLVNGGSLPVISHISVGPTHLNLILILNILKNAPGQLGKWLALLSESKHHSELHMYGYSLKTRNKMGYGKKKKKKNACHCILTNGKKASFNLNWLGRD